MNSFFNVIDGSVISEKVKIFLNHTIKPKIDFKQQTFSGKILLFILQASLLS